MAPNKNKGVFRPQTQREIPTRFRCKVGGEWKSLDAFSQSQQKLIGRGGKIDAAHSGMTCRDHTSKARTELRCDLCGLIKSKDQFSKNSLRNEEYKCMRCTAWTETQEPSVTPAPLETGHISAEEERSTGFRFVDSADFFGDIDQVQVPISRIASLNIDDKNAYGQADGSAKGPLSRTLNSCSRKSRSQVDTVSVSGESVASSSYLPPHLMERAQASRSGAKSLSCAPSALGNQPKKELPPHLTAAKAYKEQLNSTSSVSTATTVQETKKSRQIPFNAWDSTGRLYQDYKDPTERSSMSSAASITSASNTKSSVNDDPNVIGDWDVTGPPEPEAETRGNGRWPKSGSTRIPESELKKQPVLTHVKVRHIDPDVDRQRRMHYCDSDDSDY